MVFPKISTWAFFWPSTYFIIWYYIELICVPLFLLSRSQTISNTYILPVGNTPYRKRRNTRTICITPPLQSILEEGLHSRQSFWVRLTNQFDASTQKTPQETKATTNKFQTFKANINWSTQQDCCTYEYDMASVVLCEISSTHNPTQTNQPTTQP